MRSANGNKPKCRQINWARYAPPGAELKGHKYLFRFGLILALIYAACFLLEYGEEYGDLFWVNGDLRVLRSGVVMPDFVVLLDNYLIGFGALAVAMLLYAGVYYQYHRQETKSIYLMRRLPNRWELHRRCWTLPVVSAAASAAAGFVVLLLFFWLYMEMTPASCLTPGQWQKLWRELL